MICTNLEDKEIKVFNRQTEKFEKIKTKLIPNLVNKLILRPEFKNYKTNATVLGKLHDTVTSIYKRIQTPEFNKSVVDWVNYNQNTNLLPIDEKLVYPDTNEPLADIVIDDYYKITDKNFKDSQILENLKKASNKIITSLNNQLEVLKNNRSKTKLELLKELEKINKNITEKHTVIGIVNYVQYVENVLNKYEDFFINQLSFQDPQYVVNVKNLIESFGDLDLLELELKKLAQDKSLKKLYPNLSPEELEPIKDYTAKTLLDQIQKVIDKKRALLTSYYDYSVKTSSIFLSFFTDTMTEEEIFNKLLEMKDINDASRWGISMTNVNNDILQIISKSVLTVKYDAKRRSNEKVKEINSMQKKFTDYITKLFPNININDNKQLYDLFLEKDLKGNLTGKETRKYLDKAWRMSLEETFRSLPKVPKDASREEERLIKKQRFAIIENWIIGNTDLELRKKFNEEYNKKKKESLKFVSAQDKIQKQKDFDRWVIRNVRFGEPFDDEIVVYPKIGSEFFKPNDKWLNKDYAFIHQKDNNGNYVHKPLIEAYEFYVETKKEADEKLPYSYRKYNEILSLRASGLDVLKTKGIKGYWEYIKRMFKHDSFEKDEIGQQNSKGEIVNYIPIFFTGRVLNPKLYINSYIEANNGKFLSIEETNLNLFDSLKHFVEMSYNYNALEGINANLEICKDVIRKTQIIKEDAKGNITKVAGKFGENSNLIKIFNDWIASNVYGQTKVKESFLGVNEKTIDKIIQFNALTMLGLNIFTPIQNVLMGTAVRRIAAIGSEFYTSKDLNEAEKTYLLENPLEMMNDAFEVQPKHKINLLRELFLLAESNKDFDRLQRASKNNYLRTFDSVSEHFISSLSMLAILNNKGLYNRITVNNGKLVLPPDLNKKEITDITFLIKQEIQSKDGTYTTESKAAISRFLIGRMIMNFRNWIQPTINDRLGFQREGGKIKGIFNHYTKKEKKGYYISLGQFGYALFNDLKLAVAQAQSLAVLADTVKGTYNNLSELDKINLTKCLVESAYLLGTYLLATTLKNLSDDDDDNMFLAFMSYNANRFNTELAFYLPIVGTQQMLDILDSPAVIVSSSNRMLEMFKMVGFDYKDNELNWLMNDVDSNGENKFAKALVRNTPIINQMQRFSNLVK